MKRKEKSKRKKVIGKKKDTGEKKRGMGIDEKERKI